MAECQNIEYKESWRDEYLKWICGFANAQGGKIYIGIDDKGNVCGVKNSKKLLEDIPNKLKNILGMVADVNLHSTEKGDYIEIVVEAQPSPISYYGEYHYRSGSTKQLLTGQQLNTFLMKKTGVTWDSVVVNVSPNELRMDSFDIFREKAVKSYRMSYDNVNIDNSQLLDSLNLLEDKNLKRAGVLLFHHNPEKWIPGCYIKIGYFSSNTEIVYQDEIHGSLLSQAEKTVDLIYTKYLKGIISYNGVSRVENYLYPREAIREAVMNAIAHRNYASLIPIQIKIYDNLLEISNDCVFPDGWTYEDFFGKHRSKPYNPLIANAFYRAGYIESWGRGILKITESCKNAGNEIPEYIIKKDEITVIFKANKFIKEKQKELFDEQKELFDGQKELFDEQKELFDKINTQRWSAQTKNNIIKICDSFYKTEYFGRSDISDLCKINNTNAGKLLEKLKVIGAIENVIGYGKGKYRIKYRG